MYLHLWTPKVACNNLSVTDVRALTPALRAAHDKALAAGAAVPTSVSNSLLRLEREAAAFDVAAPEPDAVAAPDVNLARAALASAWRTASAQLDVWVKIDKASNATEAETLRGRVLAGAKPLAFLSGKVRAGDNVYAFSREHDLYDTTAQVSWRGRRAPLAALRVQGVETSVDPDMSVLVVVDDVPVDVSRWVGFEERGQRLFLGSPKRRRRSGVLVSPGFAGSV